MLGFTFQNKFFVGSTSKKRFRLPFWNSHLGKFIPQPRFLKRWYYRKSFDWWEHPSNHHWKGWELPNASDGEIGTEYSILEGERDLWTGMYCSGQGEKL
jgi:hypothetical protein